MGRVLNNNVWVDGVMYAVGSTEGQVGAAAGAIGDHAWRVVADGPSPVAVPPPAGVPSPFDPVEVGPSQFDALPVSPDPETPNADDPPAIPIPPKGGKGSSATHWLAYAAASGVEVPAEAERSEIIEALKAADVPTE